MKAMRVIPRARVRKAFLGSFAAVLLGLVALVISREGSHQVLGSEPEPIGTITLPAGSNPKAIEFYAGGNKLFVYDDATNSLLVIDGATEQVLPGAIPIPGGAGETVYPGALVVSEASGKIFAANSPLSAGQIVVVDAITQTVVGDPVPMGCSGTTMRLAVNDATGKLWFTCSGNIGVMDIATRAVTLISTGDPHVYGDLKVNAVANEVYVSELGMNRLAIVDGDTLGATFFSFAGLGHQPDWLGVNPAEHKVYVKLIVVEHQGPPAICIIDLDVAPLGCTFVGQHDYGAMAFNPLTNRIFASTEVSSFGAVIEGATNTLTDVSAPGGSGGTVVRQSTDHGYVFSCDEIGVLDGGTKTELLRVALPACGGGTVTVDGAVNQATGRVYSIHSGSSAPAPILHVMQDSTATPTPGCTTYPSSDVPKPIADLATTLSTLSVGDALALTDVNVRLSITHSWDQDLDVFLISPLGTRVELFTDVGGYGENFTNTVLDDECARSITSGTAPFGGCYRPEGLLSALDGQDASGVWTLELTDGFPGNAGTLQAWSLELCSAGDDVDSDGDGWSNGDESYLGTDPLDACPDNETDDAWPPDINMDSWADVGDILEYKPVILTTVPPSSPRYDLDMDQYIDVGDILMYKPVIMTQCEP